MKNKRLLGIVLILALIIGMVPAFSMTAFGAADESYGSGTAEDPWKIGKTNPGDMTAWVADDNTTLYIRGTGEMAEFNLEPWQNYTPWERYRYNIKKVDIGEGVTSISCISFMWFSNIKQVIIPSSLKTIGWQAFYDCDHLYNVNFPEGLETIEQNAFKSCDRLTNITLPSSLTRIGEYAFYNDENYVVHTVFTPAAAGKKLRIDLNAFKYMEWYYANGGTRLYEKDGTLLQDGQSHSYYSNDELTWRELPENNDDISLTTSDKDTTQVLTGLKMKIKSAKALKGKKAKIWWQKNSRADGYQLYYKAKGVKAVIKNIDDEETVKKTVKKLRAGKKYSFMIRPYVNAKYADAENNAVFDETLYGEWSEAVKVNVKK